MSPSCCGNNKAPREHKTVNIFMGVFYVTNSTLGYGYLGVPYAFFYSGYLAAIPTLLLISFISWINANYLLEIMARAQALEYLKKSLTRSNSSSTDATSSEGTEEETVLDDQALGTVEDNSVAECPKFELTFKRKFEIPELCEIFLNKYVGYLYMMVLSMYGLLGNWIAAAVATSAWATNIPFRNFGSLEMCSWNAFFHHVIPSDGCLSAYYFCLMMFAIIAISVSLFDLKEQAIVHVSLGLLRFVTLGAMVLYCIIRLAQDGDPCTDMNTNLTTPTDFGNNSTMIMFDLRGWVLAIPVFTSALFFHTGLPSLTHPVDHKKYHHWLVVAVILILVICYLIPGLLLPQWFRTTIQETCTLSWAVFTHRGYSFPLRLLSYFIVVFPSFDQLSSFPLWTHVIVNNLYILITGQDTSKKPKYRFYWYLKIFLRFIVALIPILGAFGVANIIYILKYSGLVGFLCLLVPFLLQLRSIAVCKKKFSEFCATKPGSSSVVKRNSDRQSMRKNEDYMEIKDEILSITDKEVKSLLSKKDNRSLYMTPYSYIIFSHPATVLLVGCSVVIMFIVGLASLFVEPEKLMCSQ